MIDEISLSSRLRDTRTLLDSLPGILTLLRNTLGIPKARARSRSPRATELSSTLVSSIKEEPLVASLSTQDPVPSHIAEEPRHVPEVRTDPPRIEIFGPRGLRRFLRLQMLLTHTNSQERYAVHELLTADQAPSCPGDIAQQSDPGASEEEQLAENEAPGQDIRCDSHGYWRGIVVKHVGSSSGWVDSSSDQKGAGRVIVDAGPIDHRDPCIGYVIREVPHLPGPPALQMPIPVPRKLVILGDTFNADSLVPLIDPPSPDNAAAVASGSAMRPIEVDMDVDMDVPPGDALAGIENATVVPDVQKLIARTPVSLLIHEATDAYIPPSVDPQGKTGRNRTAESVNAKTLDRGHSTPAMAGEFARKIGAERLVLNHIGARFPAPPAPVRTPWERFQLACMREIERQAHATWRPPNTRPPTYVTAAYDYYRITIPPNRLPRTPEDEQDEQRVERDVSHRETHKERHEGRFDRGGGSHTGRQTDRRYDGHTEPGSGHGGRPFDPNSRELPPRPEASRFARHELAHQTRETVVLTNGVDYDFPHVPFVQRTAVGRNDEGPSARMNENGKRDRVGVVAAGVQGLYTLRRGEIIEVSTVNIEESTNEVAGRRLAWVVPLQIPSLWRWAVYIMVE
ncbi:uncharacterized protein B0H18DRAFT_1117574 [Fomitopsis serialis]|uniref:uncharacterized protein n=1 Tax=Fomitopsis serialis TaxID=139415 RepID=UPI0020083F25|nr:uncharacterized protein B0H18DRAFT_1117574 [Neoantrodia serialis]KAH9929226.1 hypothetical protein B0H18DRAFT_1117574 [Neoantrodia serialis]